MLYMIFMEYDIFSEPSTLKIYQYNQNLFIDIYNNLENEFIEFKYHMRMDRDDCITYLKDLVSQYDLSVRDFTETILSPGFHSCDEINDMIVKGVI